MQHNDEKFLNDAYTSLVFINKLTEKVWAIEKKDEGGYQILVDEQAFIKISNAYGLACFLQGIRTGFSYEKCLSCKARIMCELNKEKFGDKYCRRQLQKIKFEYDNEKENKENETK